jgi:hypothetical protein
MGEIYKRRAEERRKEIKPKRNTERKIIWKKYRIKVKIQ